MREPLSIELVQRVGGEVWAGYFRQLAVIAQRRAGARAAFRPLSITAVVGTSPGRGGSGGGPPGWPGVGKTVSSGSRGSSGIRASGGAPVAGCRMAMLVANMSS